MSASGFRPGTGQRDVQHGVQSAGGTGQRAHSFENRSPPGHCQRPQNRTGLRKRNQQPKGRYNNNIMFANLIYEYAMHLLNAYYYIAYSL